MQKQYLDLTRFKMAAPMVQVLVKILARTWNMGTAILNLGRSWVRRSGICQELGKNCSRSCGLKKLAHDNIIKDYDPGRYSLDSSFQS